MGSRGLRERAGITQEVTGRGGRFPLSRLRCGDWTGCRRAEARTFGCEWPGDVRYAV